MEVGQEQGPTGTSQQLCKLLVVVENREKRTSIVVCVCVYTCVWLFKIGHQPPAVCFLFSLDRQPLSSAAKDPRRLAALSRFI